MRTINKVGIGVLVGLFFAAGNVARTRCDYREREIVRAESRSGLAYEGTRVASSRLTDVANVDIRPVQTLQDVLTSLRQHYVEQLTVESEGKMTYDALRAMLGSFSDPNTRFIDPSQRKLLADSEQGEFHGIGAILAVKQTWKADKKKPKEQISTEHLIVVTLLPGGPAEKAGLKAGDEIISIDGKDVLPFDPYQRINEMMTPEKLRDMKPSQKIKIFNAEKKRIDDGIDVIEAEQLLISNSKKPFDLTIAATKSSKSAKVTIQPEDVKVESVGGVKMEDGEVGYVKVGYFGVDTAEKFSQAMEDVESKSAKGLIVDLRGSTGGNIESAEKVASWFTPDRVLATLMKSRGRKAPIRIPASTNTWKKPVVLLVDRSTTRIPEVLAAGLKENGAAKLIGEKTYGDFRDTTVIDLADGSAVVLSTGKYITNKGVDYNTKGVPVDIEAASSDQQLKEAIKLLNEAGGRG